MKALLGNTKGVNNLDDNKIIEMYFARDEAAIAATAEKYGRLCHTVAFNILGNNEDSEECVNDVYMGVWNAIPPTKPNNFMAFLCKITRNLSLKRLEMLTRQKRSAAVTLSLAELEEVLCDESISDDTTDERLGELISRFLKTEKEDARNVFIRKYYFFDSVEDIARRYSFTKSKVKSTLYHTRNRLKNYLLGEGITI